MTLLRQSSIHPLYQAEEKHFMKPSAKDKVTGKLHEVKGGELTDNAELEADGQAEENAGRYKTG